MNFLVGESAPPTSGGSAAAQSDQETATSTTLFVTPGRQQFHPSAPKCWVYVTGGGTPVISASYNITSITDSGVGKLTVTIATDFSSANWCAIALVGSADIGGGTQGMWASEDTSVGKAAGSVLLQCADASGAQQDPTNWNFMGLGDQ